MIIFPHFNDRESPLQQEGFQLSYDLRQAANLLEDAAPCLVITEADIWKKVADRLPFTPENLYFIQSLEMDFLDDFVREHSAYNAVVGLGGGRVADIAKYLHWKKEITLYQIPTILSVDAFFTHDNREAFYPRAGGLSWHLPDEHSSRQRAGTHVGNHQGGRDRHHPGILERDMAGYQNDVRHLDRVCSAGKASLHHFT